MSSYDRFTGATLAKDFLSQIRIEYVEAAPPQLSTGQTIYRVMAGSYSIRENAESQVQRLKSAGFDAVITIYNK